WYYEMTHLGFNYRLTDIQAALGTGQLEKLNMFLDKRLEIANKYNAAFEHIKEIKIPKIKENIKHAWHLYVIEIAPEHLNGDRDQIFKALRAENIGVNVHYIPVHLHPYYRDKFKYMKGDYPISEEIFRRVISLPIFPKMTDNDVNDVIQAIEKVVKHYKK
ncbi:MAG: DegT/DnrJ/EryC1/StrS family aminotransferase, partial [Candidatus Peribacteraceae bacterium]|nr:DegT/DnrJ/EryC1/StrS family aminotransferase [Candidatus Peribacteraceae bacterium]